LIAKTLIDADANKSIVRNVIGRRTGQTVLLSACHYLGSLSDDLKIINGLTGLSSPACIIDYFQNHKYDYIVLYNTTIPQYKSEIVDLVNDNYISFHSLFMDTEIIVPANERLDTSNYALDNRSNRNLQNDQNLFMALAWVVPSERRMLELYPDTLFGDALEDTNKEGLTIGGCDLSGKMFTFLRTFLANQRSWSFRWIFMQVLPTMFSKNIFERIKVIISDGDLQKYQQIDAAIATFNPKVKRIRCSWHVIDRGWDRHGPQSQHFTNKLVYKTVT